MTDQDSGQPYKCPDQPQKRIVSFNAFGMWMIKAMPAAFAEKEQNADLGVLDILFLHSVNHRGRAKKLADIVF